MSALQTYLLRILACAFLVSLTGSLPLQKPVRQVLRLCGGCLMALTVLLPLLHRSPLELESLYQRLPVADSSALEQAEQTRDALLRSLVEEQTLELLTQKAEEIQARVSFTLTVRREGETGLYVPDSVEIRGIWDEAQREALEALLQDLGIPPEKQRWLQS